MPGYFGAGLGSGIRTGIGVYQSLKQQQMQKEEAERQANYQAWLQKIEENKLAKQAEMEQAEQTRLQGIRDKLGVLAAGTPGDPGYTRPAPGANITKNLPAEDLAALQTDTAALPAERPAIPGIEGDKTADMLLTLLGGGKYAPADLMGKAESYLMNTTIPEAPARDVEKVASVLSPNNHYVSMLTQPGLSNKEFDDWAAKALTFEEKQGMTPEELEKARLELELLRARIGATNRSNRDGDGGSGTNPSDKAAYDSYLKTFAKEDGYYVDPSGEVVTPKTLEQFSATSKTGRNLPFDSAKAGPRYTQEHWDAIEGLIQNAKNPTSGNIGSFDGAMYQAMKAVATGKGDAALIEAMKDRWNALHPTQKRTDLYWKNWFAKQYKVWK